MCMLLTVANGNVDALRAPSLLGADSCTVAWLLDDAVSDSSSARVRSCRLGGVRRGQKSHNCAFTQSPCGRPSWTLRLIRRRRANRRNYRSSHVICVARRAGAQGPRRWPRSTARPFVDSGPSRHPVGALRKSTRRCAVVPQFRRRSARCARSTSRKCSTSRTFVSISSGARRGPAAIRAPGGGPVGST